ncbi:MAG: sigma-54-dependent Fis family transcriptional regulator [Deltaproteobacteria bacterium]|nr:sigma-54-dependent Fis family transcriptional regulator [Deltaproteobacteria bacterium]
MTEKILIVDDEPEMLSALKRIFTRKGYSVTTAQCGTDAWKFIEETMFDLIISDLAMKDMSGIELLKLVRSSDLGVPFIIITGVGTIETAVEAIQIGAFHYVTKPFKSQDIEILAQRALEYGKLNRQINRIKNSEKSVGSPQMLVGNSGLMHDIMKRIEKISDSIASVLIMGETGTGKSLLAHEIHKISDRKDRPFLTIDCASLTETLLESELFGHVRGAFTGAVNAKRGLLEEAQGGTIFLDEISEIKPSTQVKLLRAIQEGLIKPVGSNNSINIDVRFLSATSRNLQREIIEGNFREELYYRLAVIPITLPSLKERRDDIPLLVDFFLDKFCSKYKKNIIHINSDVLEYFMKAPWKGNIRELANIVERAVLLSEGKAITLDCLLQSDILRPGIETDVEIQREPLLFQEAMRESEIRIIKKALKQADYNRSEAARILGISRRALYYKIEAYSIDEFKP